MNLGAFSSSILDWDGLALQDEYVAHPVGFVLQVCQSLYHYCHDILNDRSAQHRGMGVPPRDLRVC